ncbi:YraN family protein [Vibrio sp. SCSIO 43136]|uniref:YraN family protein n=1 Tax=Vibrio sp. SCSIO 43136 TaxID=2819101 RepID=UPI0020763877|nr:YraN family protein [Vibrio sp. SCSIO 43136]USD64874.1 YraN family protein [Vibrio sp. SCSIO 43136]
MAKTDRRKLGQHYESVAHQHLERHGLQLISRNFNCKTGEIDLIMREQQCIVFVEVKYRQQQSYGHAAEMVTYSKQQKLYKTALYWLMRQGLNPDHTEFRFDIVAIHQHGKDIDWLKNAITQG